MSLSELAGNLSFLCIVAAYLCTDILQLRLLAAASVALSILFQYYRAAPLWIPIRWNALLLAVKTAMLTALVLERRRANSMPPELEDLYSSGHFEKRGFSRVEFMRLFGRGRERSVKANEFLTREGQVNTKLYLLTAGTVAIKSGAGNRIATVTPYHFIGEMAFLSYSLLSDEEEEACGALATTATTRDCEHPPTAVADAVADTNCRVWEWDFEQLKTFLRGEHEVSNALSAYLSHDLRAKLARTGVTLSQLDAPKKPVGQGRQNQVTNSST
jgi:CRP-like cAMP-binding protein